MRWRPRHRAVCLLPGLLFVVGVRASASPDLPTEFDRALSDFEEAQRLRGERPERAGQLFRLAAQRFESIIATGVDNGRLEFNLANCYLQSGDVGRAVLHYRRAGRLIPRDPLLADNLGVARSRCLTTIRPTRQRALWGLILSWHYQTSIRERARAAVLLYAAFWGLLIIRNFARRRFLTVLAVCCGLLAGMSAGSVAMSGWADRNVPAGVVTAMDVVVYKGPGTGYQRQFEQPLQPGVEFTRRERRGGWWRIELVDGQSGWIEAAQTEILTRDKS